MTWVVFRVNAFHERGNLAAALRLIPNEIKTLLSWVCPTLSTILPNYPRGLGVEIGRLAQASRRHWRHWLDKINAEKSHHIITIEDPIEFTQQVQKSVVVQREVHYDYLLSFSAALARACVRIPMSC